MPLHVAAGAGGSDACRRVASFNVRTPLSSVRACGILTRPLSAMFRRLLSSSWTITSSSKSIAH